MGSPAAHFLQTQEFHLSASPIQFRPASQRSFAIATATTPLLWTSKMPVMPLNPGFGHTSLNGSLPNLNTMALTYSRRGKECSALCKVILVATAIIMLLCVLGLFFEGLSALCSRKPQTHVVVLH